MRSYSDTTIIIPTLNEYNNIGRLIDRIKRLYPRINIVVTDDGSTDGTRTVAREKRVAVVDRTHKEIKGITIAVLDATKYVTTKNIIVMDGDLQHPPEKINAILEKLEYNDIIIAARRKVLGPWGPIRHIESKMASTLAIIRLRKNIRDPLSGFFAVKTNFFRKITKSRFQLNCFKILFNILKSVDLRKTKIDYVLYDFNIRQRGESKIGKRHIYYFIRNLIR